MVAGEVFEKLSGTLPKFFVITNSQRKFSPICANKNILQEDTKNEAITLKLENFGGVFLVLIAGI